MSGCFRTKKYDKAWASFELMQQKGIEPDDTTIATMLPGMVASQAGRLGGWAFEPTRKFPACQASHWPNQEPAALELLPGLGPGDDPGQEGLPALGRQLAGGGPEPSAGADAGLSVRGAQGQAKRREAQFAIRRSWCNAVSMSSLNQ